MHDGDGSSSKAIKTGRLGRLASLARAGMGAATSVMVGSSAGLEQVVDRLGELRGMGTKVGQMAGLVEANLPPDVRAKVSAALARLRDRAARSPYEDVARVVREDLGAQPEELFARFEREPFASASLGQVHHASHHDGRQLAVKVQHPGIREAFENDMSNVASIAQIATAFWMPSAARGEFLAQIRQGFLAELDYGREAENLRMLARVTAADPDLELPYVVAERSSGRVLSMGLLSGVSVEAARSYPDQTRRRQAAAIRRFVLSALADHGVLYADAHAGNFLFRAEGTVGALDFGSVFRFDPARTRAFGAYRDALAAADRPAFGRALKDALELDNDNVVQAIADVQYFAVGGLVRGEPISEERVRAITRAAAQMKSKLLRERLKFPWFLPFFMRTMLATNVLLAALNAPESGPLGRLPGELGPPA
jgi:predicted unusual protein kinase regulating ubiquinone biosynthesis (AarF/ABC1/UbiB family)